MKDLYSTLEQYGANIEGLRLFDVDEPGLLPYATLVAARNTGNGDLSALIGVYEWQSNPLIFLVNGDDIRDDNHFRHIRRCVALRGDASYLGVVRPGQLIIHRVSLDVEGQDASQLSELPAKDARATFSRLANFRPAVAPQRKWISQVVLKLLRETICELLQCNVTGNDAISLTGRALFLRFLADRKLLPVSMGPDANLFDDADRAKRASRWLDDTFNGDFLPISDELFARLPESAFHFLSNILHRAPGGQLYLGWQENWDYLDFAHIPVGVLSEAYEHYMREHKPDKQRKEGSYYTPRAIVDLMVNAAFHALRREGKAPMAVVLDPAAGAGVFLVSAFRQLVAERWSQDRKRPDTQTLREILYRQIVGFDINEAALRFAALGLYLISIELDPEPEPVGKLRFNEDLRGVVLHELGNNTTGGLGSLGKTVSTEHVGRYDLVIGNPPWASATKLPGWSEVTEIVANIARERLPHGTETPPLPNEVLDLPFVWRAMEWAKPGGQIAFALHARLLFLQGDGMFKARSALFRALDVSGVLNGAELCQTRVWPEISAPFCLLFARNQSPPPGAAFRFVSPHMEKGLNDVGIMRVDTAKAELVTPNQVAECPELLKILFRGSVLDLEVFNRMATRELVTLEQYWRTRFGGVSGKLSQAGNGYQRLRLSTKKPQKADHLIELPELSSDGLLPLLIDTSALPLFNQLYVHRARRREIYRAPILLVQESPPVASGRIRVALAEDDLVFNQSFHGYSAWGDLQGHQLLRYIALIISSRPALWHVLVTSGRFGVERRVVEKITIDSIPLVPFDSLGLDVLEQIDTLFSALVQKDSPDNWAAVDAWAANVYGLREQELQVIDDTLRFNMPYAKYQNAAQTSPTQAEVIAFCDVLENDLNPWAEREGTSLDVLPMPLPAGVPWAVVRVCVARKYGEECTPPVDDWPEVLRIADSLAATEVIHPASDSNCLWIARLNQARYWSRSQARLVARRIAWEYLDVLFGSETE